jgi:hypothetical protein
MGIFYQPPLSYFGNQQPLQERELVPPSGPAPQNPPVVGAAFVTALAIISATWIAPDPPFQVARNLVPQQAANTLKPLPAAFPSNIYDAWWNEPALIVDLALPAAQASGPVNLPPPPQLTAILNAWIPAAPPFQAARNVVPQSGVTPPPSVASGPPAGNKLIGWFEKPNGLYDKTITLLFAPAMTPQSASPPVTSSAALAAIIGTWQAAAPPFQVAKNLNPPSGGPAPQNPPAARLPLEIFNAWNSAPAVNYQPQPCVVPQSTSAPFYLPPPPRVAYELLWVAAPPTLLRAPTLTASGPQNNPPPIIGAASVAAQPIVAAAWIPADPPFQVARNLVPQQAATQKPLPAAYPLAVIRSWDTPPPAPILAKNLNPPIGGPAAQRPPVIGSVVPYPVLAWWHLPPPAPILAKIVDLSAPTPPPIATPILWAIAKTRTMIATAAARIMTATWR